MPAREGTVTLSDGRTLSYAEYGDPHGRPIIFFHGWPNSRRLAALADETAGQHGVRLISPERPGFGQSDFQPGRSIRDWPRDVLELASVLGIERFSVIGLSGGGPYAAACAALIPDRLDGVAIVSSPAPFDAPRKAIGQGRVQRFFINRLAKSPRLVAIGLWTTGVLARRAPGLAVRLSTLQLSKFDRKLLARPDVQAVARSDVREAFRHGGRGPAWELVLLMRPWGVRLEDISAVVNLWHGTGDTTVPVAMGRYLAATLPHCNARFYDREGHLLMFERMKEIQDSLPG